MQGAEEEAEQRKEEAKRDSITPKNSAGGNGATHEYVLAS